MNGKKVFKIISSSAAWLLAVFILLIAFSIISVKYRSNLGYRIFSVVSGSMEPDIRLGSMIVSKKEQQYGVDDIITFFNTGINNGVTTHRIIAVNYDENSGEIKYETKGDMNEDADRGQVGSSRILGRSVFHIPYAGYPLAFAKTQAGFILFIVIPVTLIINAEVTNIKKEIEKIIREKKKKGSKKKKFLDQQ